jgi:hypothetical protein
MIDSNTSCSLGMQKRLTLFARSRSRRYARQRSDGSRNRTIQLDGQKKTGRLAGDRYTQNAVKLCVSMRSQTPVFIVAEQRVPIERTTGGLTRVCRHQFATLDVSANDQHDVHPQ